MKKIKFVTRMLMFVFFTAFIFTVAVSIGHKVGKSGYKEPEFENSRVVERADYDLDKETKMAFETAERAAYQYTSAELDKWIEEMMLDTGRFADEYFRYGPENSRGLLAVYHGTMHKLFDSHKTADEALREDLERQISNHLFNKNAAQERVENITNEAVSIFMRTFNRELVKIKERHNIPKPVWDKHIYHLCSIAAGFESRSVPMATKIIVASAAGITLKVTAPLIDRVGRHVGERLAAMTGTKTVVSNLGKAIPGIGQVIVITVLGWDLIDYKVTAEKNKRNLKIGFEQYFQEMKRELLGPTEDSIMGSVILWENMIKSKL